MTDTPSSGDKGREETEYEKKTKEVLLLIFNHLEKCEYYEAVTAISDLVGDDSLKPLISVLDEKKRLLEIITKIMKLSGDYIFLKGDNPKPTLFECLEKDEKIWYQCCFSSDSSQVAPKKDFQTMFDLIKEYPDLGRKRIIQMYFFGEYFGVNDITDEDISRKGLGLAIEKGRRFILSWDFRHNKPFKESRFFMYDGQRHLMKYVDHERNLFTCRPKEGVTEVTFSPFPKQMEGTSPELKRYIDQIYEIGKVSSGYYRRDPGSDYGLPFPRYKFIKKEALQYHDRYRDRYRSFYFDDEPTQEIVIEEETEEVQEERRKKNSIFLFIPNRLLHFYRYESGSLATILNHMLSIRRNDALKRVFSHFPASLLTSIRTSAYKSWGTTPLFYSILDTENDELIDLCIDGLGESSRLLCESIYTMESRAGGKGFSRNTPLIHKIYDGSCVTLPRMDDVYLSSEEEERIGMIGYEIKSKVRKAAGEVSLYNIVGDEKEEEEVEPEILEIAKKYNTLKQEKFDKQYEIAAALREVKNIRLKRLMFKLRHFLNFSASNSSGGYRRKSGSSFIERVIMDDNLEIAKYLIEDLMVDKPGQNPIRRKLNYFHLDDLKVTGEKKVNESRRRLGLSSRNSNEEGSHNKTYRYVLSRRTFWNPSNFKHFSQEYQHIVYLFLWIMEQKEWFLPQEMVCSVFQFLDFFAFEYILGKELEAKTGQKVYIWNHPLPDFLKVNMKNYYHLVLKIKEKGRECFHVGRGQAGEMEFKSILEHLLFERNEKRSKENEIVVGHHLDFFTYMSDKEEEEEEGEEEGKEKASRQYYFRSEYSGVSVSEHQGQHHHGLITLVHHFKNEILHRMNEKNEKLDDLIDDLIKLQNVTYPKEAKRVRARIKYEKDNECASRWRRPSPAKDWLSVGGGNKKYFAEPKEAPKGSKTKREVWKSFLEFVMKLT